MTKHYKRLMVDAEYRFDSHFEVTPKQLSRKIDRIVKEMRGPRHVSVKVGFVQDDYEYAGSNLVIRFYRYETAQDRNARIAREAAEKAASERYAAERASMRRELENLKSRETTHMDQADKERLEFLDRLLNHSGTGVTNSNILHWVSK